MIPLRDTIPSNSTAWVTRFLVAANIAMFALELSQGKHLERFVERFGVIPAEWNLPTLLTSQFLHGGFAHLIGNMMYLWIFGDNVEDRLGHWRFLCLYLTSGIVAAIAQIVMMPHSTMPMVGASGAIAGILGAYFLLFPSARIVTLVPFGLFLQTVELPAFLFLFIWFLMQWASGLMSIGQVADVGGVAFWAHIGGFITGLIGIAILRPQRRWS